MFMKHILDSEPHLFESAVDQQLERLAKEKQEEDELARKQQEQAKGSDLVLYRRMEEVRASQRQRTVQDLMYASVLHKFIDLGVDMLPPLDGNAEITPADLNKLTSGVHTPDALELVKEHLTGVLGEQPSALNAMVRISKLQGAQVYAASVMFGYFLRRVDRNFHLEKQLGVLSDSPEEQVARLERLFNSASAGEDETEEGYYDLGSNTFESESAASVDASQMQTHPEVPDEQAAEAYAETKKQKSLKDYVHSFDSQTLENMAQIVSTEGKVLAERQTGALFGRVEDLQQEMQTAVSEMAEGSEISSPKELMQFVSQAVENGKVQTLTLPYITQRRIVLEAVAFGAYLRDTESHVQREHTALLTPAGSGGGGGASGLSGLSGTGGGPTSSSGGGPEEAGGSSSGDEEPPPAGASL
jgi:hypothetical protein